MSRHYPLTPAARLCLATATLLLALAALACGASAATPQPQQAPPRIVETVVVETAVAETPLPTATPRPTATPLPTEPPYETGNLADLLADGKVEMRARGSGIDQLEIDLRSLIEDALEVEIPAGTYFVAQSAGVQNMVVRRTEYVFLPEGSSDWINALLEVACGNLHLSEPYSGDTFTVQRSPAQRELELLMPVLEAEWAGYDVEQAAIWIVTDNATYDDLGILVGGFGFGSRIIDEDITVRAMQIVDKAGIDITRKAIWRDREMLGAGVEDRALADWLIERESGPPPAVTPSAGLPSGSAGGGDVLMTLFESSGLESLAVLPNGAQPLVAAGLCPGGTPGNRDCADGEIRIWAMDTGTLQFTLPWHGGVLAFSPDGSLLAAATCTERDGLICLNSSIALLDWTNGELLREIAHPSRVYNLGFAPDSQQVAGLVCVEEGEFYCLETAVQLWNVSTGARGRMFEGLTPWAPFAIRSLPRGDVLVAPHCLAREAGETCSEAEVTMWSLRSGDVLARFSPAASFYGLDISPDGSLIAATGQSFEGEISEVGMAIEALYVWDVATGDLQTYLPFEPDVVSCGGVAFVPQDTRLAYSTCAVDENWDALLTEIWLWDTQLDDYAGSMAVDAEWLHSIAFSPDGSMLATLGYDYNMITVLAVP